MMTKKTLKPSLVVNVITEKMFSFVLMFGLYIIFHGSSSPGGGFQGGVVIGAAYILLAIGYDSSESRKLAPERILTFFRSAGALIYVVIGMVGVLLGYSFLTNQATGFPPQGEIGSLLSGGTLMGINIAIGITVGSVVITLFYAFLESESKTDHVPGPHSESSPG